LDPTDRLTDQAPCQPTEHAVPEVEDRIDTPPAASGEAATVYDVHLVAQHRFQEDWIVGDRGRAGVGWASWKAMRAPTDACGPPPTVVATRVWGAGPVPPAQDDERPAQSCQKDQQSDDRYSGTLGG